MIYGFTFYINEIKELLSMNPGVNSEEITYIYVYEDITNIQLNIPNVP